MAQWNITHSCGHKQTHQLYGPGKDRERKAAWLETTLCSDCYRLEKEAERKESQKQAAEENRESNLPTLEGTDKQIAWAETIRAKIKTEMDTCIAKLVATTPRNDAEAQTKEWAFEDAKIILRQTRSAYWIENRYSTAPELLKRRHDKRIAAEVLAK